MKNFPYSASLKFGWETFKANVWLFVGILLVSGLIGYVPQALQDLEKNGTLRIGFLVWVLMIVFWLFSQLIDLGVTKIVLNFTDSKKVTFGQLFSQTHVLLKGVVAAFLYGLIVVVGLILLIVPGIYLGIRLQFFKYFVVDKGYGPIQALKSSWDITKGNVWNLFLFGLLIILINIAGLLVLLVGLFVSVPVTTVAVGYVFRKLEAK